MCDPITAITAGLGVLNYMGGQQQAQVAGEAANTATELSYQQNTERQQQINEQSALDKTERTKQGMLERAKMVTIAGESGALGISSDRLLSDSFMQEGTDIASLEKNRANAEKQTGWANKNAEASGQSSINKAEAGAPSLLGTGLQIGATVYTGMEKAKAKAKAQV